MLFIGAALSVETGWTADAEFATEQQADRLLISYAGRPVSVKQNGSMLDAEGHKNEKEIWGKSAKWCDYSGTVDGQRIGITLMCHPQNFRAGWMHARDYGFLAAHPFGRSAFGQGEPSQVVVKPGETCGFATVFCCMRQPPRSAPIWRQLTPTTSSTVSSD